MYNIRKLEEELARTADPVVRKQLQELINHRRTEKQKINQKVDKVTRKLFKIALFAIIPILMVFISSFVWYKIKQRPDSLDVKILRLIHIDSNIEWKYHSLNRSDIASRLGENQEKIYEHLSRLRKNGYIKSDRRIRVGSARGSDYQLTDKGRNCLD